MFRGQTHQESNLTIISTSFHEARQARHFMNHTKFTEHTSTPSRSFRRLGKRFATLNNAKATKLQKLEKCRVSEKVRNMINNSIMQPIVFIMFISSLLTKLVVKQVFELPTIYESAKWSPGVHACFAGPFSEQILGYQCFCIIWYYKSNTDSLFLCNIFLLLYFSRSSLFRKSKQYPSYKLE